MKNSFVGILLVVALGATGFAGYKYVKKGGRVNYTPPSTTTGQPQPSSGFPSYQGPSSQTNAGGEITLTISSPANNATVTSSTVKVSGRTVANADVSVNDTELKADGSGNFSTTVTLDEGENTIGIVANDGMGNSSERDLTVIYTPAQ